MSAADILARLIRKRSEAFELEQQFYLALLNERTQSSLPQEQVLFDDEKPHTDSHRKFPVTDPKTILHPQAENVFDVASPKQLARLRAAAQEHGLDWESECMQIYRCRTTNLSKRAASALIDYFEGLTALAGR